MTFPVITFHKDPGGILSLDYKYLMGSKKLASIAFRNVKIVDSLGFEYLLSNVTTSGGVDIWNSLRFGRIMVKYKPVFKEQPKKISLDRLKAEILNEIRVNEKFWLEVDNLNEIAKMVGNAKTFKELILIFK